MRIIAIIQARMGSTRLGGKVLKEIEGRTMLERVVNRVRATKGISETIVATTTEKRDDELVTACKDLKIASFRGSENDVLERYYQTAKAFKAEAVMRITSDCPLIDSGVNAKIVEVFLKENPDYVSNTMFRTYPRGLDAELFTMSTLEKVWKEAREPYQRIHVTPFYDDRADLFKRIPVTHEKDYSHYRWTVDTSEDLEFVRQVYARMKGKPDFGWLEVIDLLEKEPELIAINAHIEQKAVKEG